jgi:hypothetical protein
VNVPIAIGAAVLAPVLLGESRAEALPRQFDVMGAVSITGGLSALVYALVDANRAGWGSTQTVGLLALSVILMAVFVVTELRSTHPLVPFRIFRSRTLTGSNVSGLLIGASLFSMFFFISLYMQQVLGYDALKAGLSYLPLALAIIVSAGAASQLVTRIGFKPVLVGGLVLIAAGLLWFAQVPVDGSFAADILGPSLLAAAGLGFAFVSVTLGAVSGIAETDSGLASGLINTAQQVGGALGLAVLATVATNRTTSLMTAAHGAPGARANALTEGFQAAFLTGAGIALLGVLAALFLIRSKDSRAMVEAGNAQPEPAYS